MNKKVHLTTDGINKIVNIKAAINLGLSDNLKTEIINFISIERPLIITENIPDSNWVSGFVTAEGNFDIRIPMSKTHKIGHRVQLRFRITQHIRDIKLMEQLIRYLGSGKIYKYPKELAVSLTIFKITDITNIIIPLFEKNPLLGVKQFDYLDFCKVAKLMNEGKHLTTESLNLILTIKAGMNTKRKFK